MYYEEVFSELSRRRVRYLVVGGVALVLHGVLRLTADLDLMLDMEKDNLADTDFSFWLICLGNTGRIQ